MKKKKAVSLIVLVITIIVMAILAATIIIALSNANIIEQAQKTKENANQASEKEALSVALAEWKIVEAKETKTFEEFMKEKFGEENVTKTSEDEVTVTMESENKYETKTDGTITKLIAIGSYVQYDMPYIDMYSNIEYTSTTGWRYLGKDDVGNKLIISTGIPAILYYHYNDNIGNIEDEGKNTWWATKAEISTTADTLYQTTKGYDYNTDDGEPNKYAAYGLRYNFDKIQFTYQASGTSVSTANKGIFRKVGSTTSGTDINLNFKANGVDVVDVHNLTLAELNRATSKASETTRADTSTSSGFKDLDGTAKGLFDMQKLDEYTQNYYYWLTSPYESYRNRVCLVDCSLSYVDNRSNYNVGVRPVVILSSAIQLVDTNGDGILEIVK